MYYDKGYRARRISDLILGGGKITVEKMAEIQGDDYSLPAERMLPMFFDAADKNTDMLSEAAKQAVVTLRSWDMRDKKDSTAPSIFYKWIKFITKNTFEDEIPSEALGNLARSEVIFPFILNKKKMLFDFYDDKRTPDKVETKDYIIAKSLNDAVAELQNQLGADPEGWRWGLLHKVTLGHTLGGKWNLGPYEADGGMDTVNVADFGIIGGDFNFGHGPAQRMTVELNPDALQGESVISSGESADLNSAHYKDQTQLWLDKKTKHMLYYPKEIDTATENILVLTPQ